MSSLPRPAQFEPDASFRLIARRVTGPRLTPILTSIALVDEGAEVTALITLAPFRAPFTVRCLDRISSFGIGSLVRTALDARADRIVISGAGVGPLDGGLGAAEALGARVLSEADTPVRPGIKGWCDVARIDLATAHPRLAQVAFLFTGSAAATLAAIPAGIRRQMMIPVDLREDLAKDHGHLLTAWAAAAGRDIAQVAGGAAAGGLGAPLACIRPHQSNHAAVREPLLAHAA